MPSPLDTFSKQHDVLVAIDSDGCAFDSMEIKHKECFIPNFIRFLRLQPVSKYARECCEFTNLYSRARGANRFKAYLRALELLAQRPEVQARSFAVPVWDGVREWMRHQTKLSTGSCREEAERTQHPDLVQAAAWSAAVDESVQQTVEGVPPFPGVRETLERLQGVADLIVCSATPTPALEKEWREHGIEQFVSAICGQEVGSKGEILAAARQKGYAPDRMLMIGDAPGDMEAARHPKVQCSFFPINPGHEEASWARFLEPGGACERFLGGEYAGEFERGLVEDFLRHLPESPSWRTA